MICHLFCAYSFIFEAENFVEEVFGLVWDVCPVIVDKLYRTTFCEIFDLLNKLWMKGKLSWQHEVEYDTKTESIYFFIIFFSIVYLWCYESRSSGKFLFWRKLLQFILENSKSKIDQLDSQDNLLLFIHFYQHIFGFEVSVDDSKFLVEI